MSSTKSLARAARPSTCTFYRVVAPGASSFSGADAVFHEGSDEATARAELAKCLDAKYPVVLDVITREGAASPDERRSLHAAFVRSAAPAESPIDGAALDEALAGCTVGIGDAVALVAVVADSLEDGNDEDAARRARTLRVAVSKLTDAMERVDTAVSAASGAADALTESTARAAARRLETVQ